MADPNVNEFQQIDLPRIKKWIEEGGELKAQLDELLDLVEGQEFLQEIQKCREDQVVDQMLHDAGIIQPKKGKNGEAAG